MPINSRLSYIDHFDFDKILFICLSFGILYKKVAALAKYNIQFEKIYLLYYCYKFRIVYHSPEVGEPLDQLRCIVFVELDVGEVHLKDGRGRVPDPEEHQLRLPQMHRRQRRRVHRG